MMEFSSMINKVACIDCLEGMKHIPNESVDLIVTSPPYNCRKDYGGTLVDEMPWKDYYVFMKEVIIECYRVLVSGGVIALNVPNVVRWQFNHKYKDSWGDFDPDYITHRNGEKCVGKGRIEPLGYKLFFMMLDIDSHIREPITWVKGSEGNAICSDYRMGCDSDPYLRPSHELILLGSKDKWFHRGGTGRRGKTAVPFMDYTKDVWHISSSRDKNHPATFPIEIPLRLIKLFVHAKDVIILDPFMGSGTTAIACKQLNHNFIGFEINPDYCDIIRKKLEQKTMVDYII